MQHVDLENFATVDDYTITCEGPKYVLLNFYGYYY